MNESASNDFLGFDTSNYTTSATIYRSDENKIYQVKKLLPVKDGQIGIRQNDAVFHHTVQLPEVGEELFEQAGNLNINAVSASVKPRDAEGSYMPCFLCGEGIARNIAAVMDVPFYGTSHQTGHILAALYSAGVLDWCNKRFIAFHVSGGTTECLLCEYDSFCLDNINRDENIARFPSRVIGTSLDLKAGQAIDRVGVMLGLKFPCGAELEKLALKSNAAERGFRIQDSGFRNEFVKPVKSVVKDGNCCLSGIENQCRNMLEKGISHEDIARYCLEFIGETILAMTEHAVKKAGNLSVIYAGGVMSNSIIRENITSRYKNAKFAHPDFSCDNAVGVALFGYCVSKDLGFRI